MSTRNKGFDPLSSLFEAPDPSRGVPLDDVDPPRPGLENAPVELSDPLFKRPTPLPPGADLPENSISDVEPTAAEAALDREALARKLAQEALARARAAGSEPAPATEDKQALARKLAQEALARARAAGSEPAPATEDKQALARRLAQEAIARAAAQSQPPSPSSEDKQALARKLAQEALAKAQAAARPPSPSASPPPAAGLPPKASRKKEQDSRVASLKERARKPMNALEAARAAARDEEERQAQAIRKKATQLTDVVQDLLPAWLPGIGAIYVANAIAVRDREVLVSLWKGHRARFLADGQLERAVGAAVVLAALDQVPDGHLVAAHAVTDASDYLVWLDLDKRALVAAFANARAYFAHAS